ncbi:hypothetical protein B0J14DRAFT_657961 [Halenospora varia]|nr:hypothetical protein B0J14DRAFT_657961 [Halenospora varia]
MSTPWLHEEETGRWYMNWKDEYGRIVRRYSDELNQGSSSSAQTTSNVYDESRPRNVPESFQADRRSSTISTYGGSSKKYNDSGGYGRPTAGYARDSRENADYNDAGGSPYSGNPGADSLSGRMNMLDIKDFDRNSQYTSSPSSAYTAVPERSRGRGPSVSYPSPPVIHEDRAETAPWPSTPGGTMGGPRTGPYSSAAPPQPADQPRRNADHRHIFGTPGNKETLDPRYQIRNHDYKKFFRPGRVFSTLWTDPSSGKTNRNQTFISTVMYGEKVHTKIRRFVVVRQRDKCCTCLPVTSYEGRGHKKTGIDLEEHGQIYSLKKPREVKGISKRPLKVILSKTGDNLEDTSLINYGRMYTVESNVKVLDVGVLDEDSQKRLQRYYRDVNFQPDDSADDLPLDSKPETKEAALVGMGAGFGVSSQSYQSMDQTPMGMPTSKQSYDTSYGQERPGSYDPRTAPSAGGFGGASQGSYSAGYGPSYVPNSGSMASASQRIPTIPDSKYPSSYGHQSNYPGDAHHSSPYTGSYGRDSNYPPPKRQDDYPSSTPASSLPYTTGGRSDSDFRVPPRRDEAPLSPSYTKNTGYSSNVPYSSGYDRERGYSDSRRTDEPSGTKWTPTEHVTPDVVSSSRSPPIASSSISRRDEVVIEDDEDDDIILPTREEAEAQRSSRSRRDSKSSRSHGTRDKARDKDRHHERKKK